MRFFHTSDWHLGQSLYGQSRDYEHAAFLAWLLDQISLHRPDALLIAGDIFDTVNPPIIAQEQLYKFLADAHVRLPTLQIIMIAGNHDSGGRIELPAPLLKALNTHVIGRVRMVNGQLDTAPLLLPVTNADAQPIGYCLALPFLRPAEITAGGQGLTTMQAVEQVYGQLIDAVLKHTQGLPLVLMSHAHLQDSTISEDSERSIVIGTVEALSTDLFPSQIDYVALGHLHRPQSVGGQARIRYSGSPIPLSFSEESYKHQVLHVTLQAGQPPQIDVLSIPRAVAMKRISGTLAEVLSKIQLLDRSPQPWDLQPFLEIRVYPDLAPFPPDLKQQIEAAIPAKAVRLVRFKKESAAPQGTRLSAADRLAQPEQTPQSLYEKRWTSLGHVPDSTVYADFAQLIDELQQRDSDGAR
jgi:exonuclease SbcD